jgi:Phage integrase family
MPLRCLSAGRVPAQASPSRHLSEFLKRRCYSLSRCHSELLSDLATHLGASVCYVGSYELHGDLKTNRHVPMTDEMRQLLERMKAERGEAHATDRALLVKEAHGFITSACKKLGIARFTTHALRHLFGTACLEAGVDVRTVAGWLGHKDNGSLLPRMLAKWPGKPKEQRHEVDQGRLVFP